MKRALLLIFMLQAGTAWASWEEYSDTSTAVTYFDPASIRKEGKIYRLAIMYNMKEPYHKGIRSMRSESEIDCGLEKTRRLSLYAFSEPDLRGKMKLVSDEAEEWKAVKINTPHEVLYKRVCGPK